MIYEVRTYTLRAGATAEFEERYEKRLPLRLKHSPLGGFWHTEFGPLNQVVHVYPTTICSTGRGCAPRWRRTRRGRRSPAAAT